MFLSVSIYRSLLFFLLEAILLFPLAAIIKETVNVIITIKAQDFPKRHTIKMVLARLPTITANHSLAYLSKGATDYLLIFELLS